LKPQTLAHIEEKGEKEEEDEEENDIIEPPLSRQSKGVRRNPFVGRKGCLTEESKGSIIHH